VSLSIGLTEKISTTLILNPSPANFSAAFNTSNKGAPPETTVNLSSSDCFTILAFLISNSSSLV
jgi:hypothetical protein